MKQIITSLYEGQNNGIRIVVAPTIVYRVRVKLIPR